MNIQNRDSDFRIELYQKYISTFKKHIGNEDTSNKKSDYEIYKRKYLPLIEDYPKDASIIELGCGSGYKLQFFKEQGYNNLYGIDISEQQIEKARGNGINAEVKNVFDFFKTNTNKYDIVFAFDFIEHFYKSELLKLFTGINSILNEGGLFIVHTPNGQGLFPGRNIYGDLTHLTIFNPNSLIQILRLTGFDEIKFYETGPVPKNIKGSIRFVLWKIIRSIVMGVRVIENGKSEKILTQDFICAAKKNEKKS